MLGEQMGLSPSTAAQALEAQILADDPSLLRRSGDACRAPAPAPARREPTRLIGRTGDVAAVERHSQHARSSPSVARAGSARPVSPWPWPPPARTSSAGGGRRAGLCARDGRRRSPHRQRARRRATPAPHVDADDRGVHPGPGNAPAARQLRARARRDRSARPTALPAMRAADGADDESGAARVARRVRPPVGAASGSRRPVPATRHAPRPPSSCSPSGPPKHAPGSASTTGAWRRWRRSAAISMACRWRSSWRRRGCARSGSTRWRRGLISASRCWPGSGPDRRAAPQPAGAGRVVLRAPRSGRPGGVQPTCRCSRAASTSMPPRPCAVRPAATGVGAARRR